MGSGKVGSEGENNPSIKNGFGVKAKKLIKIKTARGISDQSLVILKLVGFEMFLGWQLNPINR
ncbi:hypothetical protein MiTs_01310 [Microcystis aeruginosa NIES-2521]|uniref:Uncharacterized protein n=1 Tax=Microcystis aeruginosa NIES-2521 TaxID=2303983 RepID=A0A5A5RT65_MICAE|nr:hypothetical protein MiTs_01310 [Microcystis aeruginosa NIES-2521]